MMKCQACESLSRVMWIIFLFVFIKLAVAGDYEMCKINTQTLNLDDVGETGNITSKGYPSNFEGPDWNQPYCSMAIKACPHCQVELNVEDLTLPQCILESNSGGCVPNCDHIFIFEPHFSKTWHIVQGSSLTSFTSISRSVNIKLCFNFKTRGQPKRFKISFHVLDKTLYYPQGNLTGSGTILAPNFPQGYRGHDDIFTYVVRVESGRKILFEFDDWNISPGSVLVMYDWDKSLDEIARYTGRHVRPSLVQSKYNVVKIVFNVSSDRVYSPVGYLGFKIRFHSEPKQALITPRTGCGIYYHSLLGGHFHLDERFCVGWMDCVWVITRYNELPFDHLALNVNLRELEDEEFLEIRSGNYSEGTLVKNISRTTYQLKEQFFGDEAFYIHLRAKCVSRRDLFQATFTSFSVSRNNCSHGWQYRCHDKDICIPRQLHCDGYGHCNDSSDETNCQVRTTTVAHIGKMCRNGYFECDNGQHYYCPWERCDDHRQCNDGIDERDCPSPGAGSSGNGNPNASYPVTWSIYIPIGLACVTAAIVVCMIVSFCTRRKHLLRRRQQRNAQRNLATPYQFNDPRPGHGIYNVENDYMTHRDAPPTYEEAVHQTPHFMFNNMGFSRSESSDGLAQPPPYTADGQNTIIPPPQPGQRNQSPPRIPAQQRPCLLSVQDLPPQVQGHPRSNLQGNAPRESDVNTNNQRHGVVNPSFETDVQTATAQPRSIVGMADMGIRFSDLREDNSYRTAVTSHQHQSDNIQRTVPKTEENGNPKIGPKVSMEAGVSGAAKENQKPAQSVEKASDNTDISNEVRPPQVDSESTGSSYV